MNYLHKTEEELEIDLDKLLSEEDSLDKLNDLAKKKKRMLMTSMSISRLTEGSNHQQDFVTIEDFEYFLNEMLYTVQEIFFRLHQSPGLDDQARTFSDIDEIDTFLNMDVSTDIEDGYHDSEGDTIYLESLLINDTILNLPPKVFLDHNPRSFKDEPDNNDLKSMVKVFDPEIHEKKFLQHM
nr:hypothetical protein [Tanacetum cinerariifolium]